MLAVRMIEDSIDVLVAETITRPIGPSIKGAYLCHSANVKPQARMERLTSTIYS